MGRVIAIANQKGGVGKTTATFNLGDALCRAGKKVLLIDNDPQANLTSYALDEVPSGALTLDQVYLSKNPQPLRLKQLQQVRESLFLVPGDQMLSGVEYYLMSRSSREKILKEALSELVNEVDFILIDNPPSLNLLTVNGLVASDRVLVPVQPEFFSLEGLSQLQSTLDDLKRWHPHVKLLGLVANMFDQRRRLNADAFETLKTTYGPLVMETRLHNSVKVAESSGFGRSVIEYAPRSRSAKEFSQLAVEVIERSKS